MKSRWAFLVLVIGLWRLAPAAAQMRMADSLQSLLRAQPKADTLRVRRLHALSKELMKTELPQAIAAEEEALALSQRLSDFKGEGAILIRLGTLYRQHNEYDKARHCAEQALALFGRRNDDAGMALAYLQLAFVEEGQSNIPAEIQAALRGLPYAERAHDQMALARLEIGISSSYVQLGNYQEAIPMLKRTIRTAQALNDQNLVATALMQLGTAYQQQQAWPQALHYFRQAAQLNRQLGEVRSATSNEVSMADLYTKQGNYAQALAHGQQARSVARSGNDQFNLLTAELVVAKAYLMTGRADSALALAQHSFAQSQHSGNTSKENLRTGSDILAQAYAKRGQYADAYRYKTLWAAYNDTIQGEQTQQKTAALRYGYELDRKQDQITLLQQRQQLQAQRAERQHQELLGLVVGLVGLLLLAGLLARNIFLKQRANRELNAKNEQIALQRDRLDQTLTKLKATQSQLVQSEKMVALAALTAGVAHEMQNPLNFVNNFSEVSLELLSELEEEQPLATHDPAVVKGLLGDLRQNLRKINQHGVRASGIVKGMLDHAHADPGQLQPVDLNALVEDYLRLAYHSLQARHRDFTVARVLDLDPALGTLQAVPQELGRVLLNLFTNAFYAVHEKAERLGAAYQPSVRVRTCRLSGCVELHVRDNGSGISPMAIDRIFDPFYTTKPPGEGTGLGLWLSYDIVTKGYGGTLTARSEEGAFAELIVTLPQDQKQPTPATALATASEP